MHFRQCELAFNAKGGGKASTVYDAIGAAQVATASFAGMRLLHHLGDALAVWPFAEGPTGQRMLVEIACRSFNRLGGARGLHLRTLDNPQAVLARMGSPPPAGDTFHHT